MKKTHKKVLGVFGLVAVAAMTAFAAFIPVPETQAMSTSVTDTIEVRVIGSTPNAYITQPANNAIFTGSTQNITYNYEYISNLSLTIEYTDESGVVHSYLVASEAPTDDYGSGAVSVDLSSYPQIYGNYVIKLVGEGADGVTHEDAITIEYVPVTATIEEDDATGDANITLNYDEDSSDIDTIQINVYDKDGNLVEELSPITVTLPDKNVTIPFSDTNLPAGEYIIVVTALDVNGNALFDGCELRFEYKTIAVPNTGTLNGSGFMAGLNISQSDYLITGLLIFFIVGAVGAFFVAKGRKSQDRRK